jgi:hypothetical protein
MMPRSQPSGRGESVRGVSPSVIHRVVENGAAELIEDPRLQADAARTPSLEGSRYSVLCAPIRDPIREAVLAVVVTVRNMVKAHGGEIRVETTAPEGGAAFTVTLPLSPASSPAASEPARTVA